MTPQEIIQRLQELITQLPAGRVKELDFHVAYHVPGGDPTHTAVFVAAAVALVIIAVAALIAWSVRS